LSEQFCGAERYGFTTSYLRVLAAQERLKAQKVGNVWLTTPAAEAGVVASPPLKEADSKLNRKMV